MAREYVPIFFDWLETTQDLSNEEKGNLIDAVMLYATGSDEWINHLETSGEKVAFRFMKGQIDRNTAISDARSKAGSSKKEQNESNENKTEQNESNSLKEKEKEKDIDKENKKESKRFTPPTLEEVNAYCKERNNGSDPQHFIDYYAARGWELKPGQKIKDWRACIRTWEQRRTTPAKTVVAQTYEQRDYSTVAQQQMDAQTRRILERLNQEGA